MENEITPAETREIPETTKRLSSEKTIAKEALLISGSLLLGSLIVAGAILTLAPQGNTVGDTNKESADNQAVAPVVPESTTVTVSMDDDAVLGDKNKAKVAIVEFTDFECPFCKKFHAETFDTLVKDYVTTGKAILVTRDFPLSFHEPKATEEAALAECVRKEKGDTAYFSFTKALYQNTVANGKGLPEGKLAEMLSTVGATASKVTACATTDVVKQEIAKDIADGSAVGISGTPSFVIGTIGKDGMVTGERIVGALPISGFKTTIEKYLAQ